MDPTDVIMLSHNRLEHVVRTVDALLERTPEPIRLTVVDNASGPEVRNWLAENRDRFDRLILRPTNEYVPAFQHGIDATTSDPYVVTDPDLIVPDLSPSWLGRQLELMRRYPDFGTIAVDLDRSVIPSWVPPETIAAIEALRGVIGEVDEDLVECRYVGTHFQIIRRDALREAYVQDASTSHRIRRAGYRVGFNRSVHALDLGSEDVWKFPEHLARKAASPRYGAYEALVEQLPRAPALVDLARAATVVARTRGAGVRDESVLELAFSAPALGAALEGPVTLKAPPAGRMPINDRAAGAVVLLDPPADRLDELLHEAFRIAARLVIVVASLEVFRAQLPADITPEGWEGHEHAYIGDLPLALARESEASGSIAREAGFGTLEHRERWLEVFGAAAFGPGERRLFVFEREAPGRTPESVHLDSRALQVWRPPPPDREALNRPVRRGDVSRLPAAVRKKGRRLVRAARGALSRK